MKRTLIAFLCTAALLVVGGCVTGNGTLPVPTANFTPQYTYNVPRDRLWQAILDALDENRITALSADKSSGIIQTDYIAGPETLIVTVSQLTRYKYNISLRDQADGSIKVNVICKLEDTMSNGHSTSQWNDVTSQNADKVQKLESWLYEQIQQELKPS